MFRSESMVLCQLFIAKEATYQSLAELGEKGLIQFKDVSSRWNNLNYMNPLKKIGYILVECRSKFI